MLGHCVPGQWFSRIFKPWGRFLLGFVFFLESGATAQTGQWIFSPQAEAQTETCEQPGWFPTSFGLKDHTVFFADGFIYIMSIYWPDEDRFAYARSTDWCNWEDLGPILTERTPGAPDELAIWSPFVLENQGTYYAYYTGVTRHFTQSIMLATSQNPADPASWQEQGVIFQPNHDSAIWEANEWADCRDPMVLLDGDVFYLYYTGRDAGADGAHGIVGIAQASSPEGPWTDLGATITSPVPALFQMLESPTVYNFQGYYYLFANNTAQGEEYRFAVDPTGPWSAAYQLRPGWAHEVWTAEDGGSYTSYLTSYIVTISPLTWSFYSLPPTPHIGRNIYYSFNPLIVRFDSPLSSME